MIKLIERRVWLANSVFSHSHLQHRPHLNPPHSTLLQNKQQKNIQVFRVKHSRKSTGELSFVNPHVGSPPRDLIRGKVLFCFVFSSLNFFRQEQLRRVSTPIFIYRGNFILGLWGILTSGSWTKWLISISKQSRSSKTPAVLRIGFLESQNRGARRLESDI